jgi:class 3 adenylate cyclase
MSRKSDAVSTVHRTVVAFDICSSTMILEDLLRTENQRRWRNLLISMKKQLVALIKATPFEIYKFVGDGWILLFDPKLTSGSRIMTVLEAISVNYHWSFHHGICDVLGITDHQIGLTFGIETGTLVKIIMNRNAEYIGRALNVAIRLQSSVKDCDKDPTDKLLISKNAYARLKLHRAKATTGTLVQCNLRNVAGGAHYQVRKITVFDKSKRSRQRRRRAKR